MRWRRAAIAACATVAALAGAVSVVAGAVAADRTSSGHVGSAGDSPATTGDASAAYRSSLTITLDRPTESCPSSPDADGAGPRSRPPCDVPVRLPQGATEEQVLQALGEPQRRRALNAGGEAWDYSRYLDEQRYAIASTTLTFHGHRLVDVQEYLFK